MLEIKLNKTTYVQRRHPKSGRRCNDCDLRIWCHANEFMMACAIFNPDTVFLRAGIGNSPNP